MENQGKESEELNSPQSLKHRIFSEVRKLNVGYDNPEKDMALKAPIEIGGVKFYIVAFEGADNKWHENYVLEFGTGKLKCYQNIQQALPELVKKTSLLAIIHTKFQTVAFSLLTVILVITVCILSLLGKIEGESIVALTTLAFGYIAGKSQPKN
ncbi:hypothetical protein ACQEXU_21055 [Vibrio sp. TRT 21S02]|uniref:hypothetical protein n=1 Tax=Vibrio sp. TRT 21S02 TaxID=3418507 RepID=UPI003CF1FC5D